MPKLTFEESLRIINKFRDLAGVKKVDLESILSKS